MTDNRRELIKQFVEREFIGPDPIDWPGLKQENGEEILVSDPPRTRYIAGILFPIGAREVNNTDEESEKMDFESESEENNIVADQELIRSDDIYEELEEAEELIDRSNAFKQSAISITVAIKDNDEITAEVKAGTYKKSVGIMPDTGREVTQYARTPINWESKNNTEIVLPDSTERIKKRLLRVSRYFRKEILSLYSTSSL